MQRPIGDRVEVGYGLKERPGLGLRIRFGQQGQGCDKRAEQEMFSHRFEVMVTTFSGSDDLFTSERDIIA